MYVSGKKSEMCFQKRGGAAYQDLNDLVGWYHWAVIARGAERKKEERKHSPEGT